MTYVLGQDYFEKMIFDLDLTLDQGVHSFRFNDYLDINNY